MSARVAAPVCGFVAITVAPGMTPQLSRTVTMSEAASDDCVSVAADAIEAPTSASVNTLATAMGRVSMELPRCEKGGLVERSRTSTTRPTYWSERRFARTLERL